MTIRIYAAAGGLVRTLELGERQAGAYLTREEAAHWDGCDDDGEPAASGVFFYTLQAGDSVITRKAAIVR